MLPSVDEIMLATSYALKIGIRDLRSSATQRYIAYARWLVMYICRQELQISFPRIARQINNMDHTSIMYGVGKIEKRLLSEDLQVRRDLDSIKARLREKGFSINLARDWLFIASPNPPL